MDALVMCGGQGTRLGGDEKPLRRVAGRTLLDRVLEAIDTSTIDTTYAVTSPRAPRTAETVDKPTIEADGKGYVDDLRHALSVGRVTQPVLTVAADLPLLDGPAVDKVLQVAGGGSLTVLVPVGRAGALGFSLDRTIRHTGIAMRPAGINVVGEGKDQQWISRDRRYAANVNRPLDLATAEWLVANR